MTKDKPSESRKRKRRFNKKESPTKRIKRANDADVQSFLEQHNITVTNTTDALEVLNSFENISLPSFVMDGLKRLKIKTPTPIQAIGLPILMNKKRDFIGVAETGSGKTYCFMIPCLKAIAENKKKGAKNAQVVVLAPTRELAKQILLETQKISGDISCAVFYGGVNKREQMEQIKNGVDIIVATPGRLIDVIEDGLDLTDVSYVVFDEADRMLDMGFAPQVQQIMKHIPKTRQTLMFSATWPNIVQKMAEDYFNNPIKVNIGSTELSSNKNIKQIVWIVDERQKYRKLTNLLNKLLREQSNKIIIFTLYKKNTDWVAKQLYRDGYDIVVMHGGKTQHYREKALEDFRNGDKQILLATDVCGRGMDIKNVDFVINYEFPLTCEDYIHRIGRTGRAGKQGVAYTFFTEGNKEHARELLDILKEANQEIPKEFQKLAERAPIRAVLNAESKMYGGNYRLFTEKKKTHIKF